MFAIESLLSLPEEWKVLLAVGAGLIAAAVTFLVFWSLFRRAGRQDEEADLREGPMMSRFLERSGDHRKPFAGGSRERRLFPRRRGGSVPIFVTDEAGETEPLEGFVVDRSMRGLGLELFGKMRVDVGEVLSVRPRATQSEVSWTRVKVHHVRTTRSGLRLGCRYVRSPDSHMLQLFG